MLLMFPRIGLGKYGGLTCNVPNKAKWSMLNEVFFLCATRRRTMNVGHQKSKSW